MEPQPCFVIDGDNRWRGQVLSWRRDAGGAWVGVARFTTWGDLGPMTYEHTVPAERLVPRAE